LQGTRAALYDNHRDSITVTVPKVTPRTVGALIALYERTVSFYASLVNVNAYHQPGVEAGKKAAASVLDLQRQVVTTLKQTSQPLSLTELAAKMDAADQVETIYKIVRHLDANQRDVVVTGNLHQPNSLAIAAR
jgi:glucose-6-phosphate isomerase